MNTYNVKQIADMLDTNPETVRRWIRSGKLVADQTSRKGGNIVTEDELQRFVSTTPKYSSRYGVGVTKIALAGGVLAVTALIKRLMKNSEIPAEELSDDVKTQLEQNLSKLSTAVARKQELIAQTEVEIGDMEQQIIQYRYLLEQYAKGD